MNDNIVANENLIQDFIDVTEEVLSTMASFEIKAIEVQEINANGHTQDVTACFDITGILGFSGGRKGSLLISFPRNIAFGAIGGMLGIEFTEIDADVRDGVSELVNMIAGGAQCQFEGLNISISLPNVIVGHNHNVSASKVTPRIVIPCTTDVGTFHVEVGMVLANKQPAAGVQTAVAGAKA